MRLGVEFHLSFLRFAVEQSHETFSMPRRRFNEYHSILNHALILKESDEKGAQDKLHHLAPFQVRSSTLAASKLYLLLSRIFHQWPTTAADMLVSTALHSKNVLNVPSSTPASIFLRAPCIHGISTSSLRQPMKYPGLICFNLQAIVTEGFFLEQFLAKTTDFMF